ncbi:HutD family protein [Streptococcus pseudoporcinus]|uniref:Uncharacterized protein n=1 Tax=Streptococcus pseudoporcinus LQ 940-04 TaxID=875093 RepID=G5KBE3_9STRE|nr:HutD family protein [Streptococcus pseudoporcinus]EFR44747.1 hypothetical protein HMPREF9320_0900 [Streptococcus pseudoporcinus SPIN 20026]EHI64386.1 hypothetical protein STRPS_1663 [Streptococcus pseudoporcinus LQ 940-04]VEF94516.1 putative cytoplasmic protein [Streptococcus pseudoporcinus]
MTAISIIKPESYSTSHWSGGKTKELYISPKTSLYLERNFDFRLSSATVSLSESIFSDLRGYHRLIMTVDRSMTLLNLATHELKELDPFETFSFEGSDRIKSIGQCTDVNLIYNDNYLGQMEAVHKTNRSICSSMSIQMVYTLCDMTCTVDGQGAYLLKANHLLVIQNSSLSTPSKLELLPLKPCPKVIAIWAGLSCKKDSGYMIKGS